MTSTKTTTSSIRTLAFFMLGLALSIFGIFQCLSRYPGPEVFVRFMDTLPLLWTIASFAIGVAAALAGLVLLLPPLFRLGRGRGTKPLVYQGSFSPHADRGLPTGRPARGRDDAYEHEPDGYEEDEYQGGTASGYGGGYGGSYPDRRHDNGEYDHRRRAGMYH